MQKTLRHPNPAEFLVAGFAVMILIGTLSLMNPLATRTHHMRLVDALFTSSSAICVTGMSVFNPGETLTLYGQVVLLILVEFGALGFMTITSAVAAMTGHRTSLQSRIVLRESINASGMHGILHTATEIMKITLACEGLGAVFLCTRFIPRYGLSKGIYYSIFHSVSSFCNAGYDVFGYGDSMIPFRDDVLVNIVTMVLVVMGGLGFFVLFELSERLRNGRNQGKPKMTLNTRVALVMTAYLLGIGAVVFLIAEGTNPDTLGAPGVSVGDRIMGAVFQSVTTRTSGFYTIPQDSMRPVSKIATVILMFIGASPAGTAGGLKTTTAAVLGAFVWSVMQGRRDVILLKRRLPHDIVQRSVALFSLAIIWVIAVISAMTVIERGTSIEAVIFETVGAFGTTGMSLGATSTLSDASLILLVITMFSGRVGLFTVTMALAHRFASHESNVRYPEERVIIG